MAVIREGKIAKFTGLSTDTKPSSTVGDEFFETDKARWWKYDGTNWKIFSAEIDQTLFSLCTIDIVHHEIHEGDHYEATHNVSVGTGTAASILITAPGTTQAHMIIDVQSDKAVTYTWSEAPDVTAGSVITPHGNNRISSVTVETAIAHTITWASSGTILQYDLLGGTTTGQRSVGGDQAGRREWVLDNDTEYLVYVTAAGATTNVIINLSWYEER